MFSSLLIANRGEIARRVIRTAHEMGIRCIAVYVDADRLAPFVDDADQAVRIESGYLDADAILGAAIATGAQAIHPGYGFLSENASFARQVEAAGLIWVGPPPLAIEAMGDKIEAKRRAIDAGIPVLGSTEDPAAADQVGFPILVKASAGGGGKGMRIVEGPEDLEDAISSARREALSGFGDDRVFLERYVAAARHVEIQILGDRHGTLLHLGERECSIQRRHQKLVEEAPSPIVDAAMRSAMGEAAITLARAIDYSSTGTVEFLVDDTTREFFFLEVNTRLQVEHPVTEEVTGIDLVRAQLEVAAGLPLEMRQDDIVVSGHAIEVRLCAEDPAGGFLPSTGTLEALALAPAPDVRWESGVVEGSEVTVSFDPMLAKVIAHGPNRAEAAGRLALALEGLHLGGVRTNRDFLAATLRSDAFLEGDTTTDFIDRVAPALTLELSETELEDAAITAALWLQAEHRRDAPVLAHAPSGWRNARLPAERVALQTGETVREVTYRARRDGTFEIDGGLRARVIEVTPTSIDLEIGDRRRRSRVTHVGDRLYVQVARGTVCFEEVPRFIVPGTDVLTGGLVAPMPGVVLEVRVAQGQQVSAGDVLVVLEAMKMEQHVSAPSDGVVTEIFVTVGEQVANGARLLQLDDEEGTS